MKFLGGHENFRMRIIVQRSKSDCNEKSGVFGEWGREGF
jgi:hypothetical protein